MKKLMIATLVATSGWFMPAMAANSEATVSDQPTNVESAARRNRRLDLFDYRCSARSYGHRGVFTARGETRNMAERRALNQCQRSIRGWNRCYITSCQRIWGWR